MSSANRTFYNFDVLPCLIAVGRTSSSMPAWYLDLQQYPQWWWTWKMSCHLKLLSLGTCYHNISPLWGKPWPMNDNQWELRLSLHSPYSVNSLSELSVVASKCQINLVYSICVLLFCLKHFYPNANQWCPHYFLSLFAVFS